MKINKQQLRKMINEAVRKRALGYEIDSGMGFYGDDDTVAVRSTGIGPVTRGYMTDGLPTAQEFADAFMQFYNQAQMKGNLDQGGLIDVANALTRIIPVADRERSFTSPQKRDGTGTYESPSAEAFDEVVKIVTNILMEAKLLLPHSIPSEHVNGIYGIIVSDMRKNLRQEGYREKFDHFQGL